MLMFASNMCILCAIIFFFLMVAYIHMIYSAYGVYGFTKKDMLIVSLWLIASLVSARLGYIGM